MDILQSSRRQIPIPTLFSDFKNEISTVYSPSIPRPNGKGTKIFTTRAILGWYMASILDSREAWFVEII